MVITKSLSPDIVRIFRFYQFSCYVIGLFEQTKAGPEGPINYDDCQWMIAIAFAITSGLSITNWR